MKKKDNVQGLEQSRSSVHYYLTAKFFFDQLNSILITLICYNCHLQESSTTITNGGKSIKCAAFSYSVFFFTPKVKVFQ